MRLEKWCVWAGSLALSSAFCLVAQSSKHGMSPDDLARMVRVGAPVLSPDGKLIAYTVSHVDTEEDKNISQLWMVNWDGTNDLQLTYDSESAANPRWSPDERYLAFTSSRTGKAKGTQVWVLDRRGGEAHQLTNVKEDLGDYRWSPDSKTLLLALRAKEEPEPEKGAKPTPPKPIVLDRYHFKQDIEGYLTDKHQHLFLFDIATAKLTRLTNGEDFEEQIGEYSPDGSQIAFTSNQVGTDPDRTNNSDLFVVPAVAASVPRRLTTFTGEDQGPLAWSPDGKRIAYRQGTSPIYSIYDMPRLATVASSGGTPELVAEKLNQWVGAPLFTRDGKALLTTVADDRVSYVGEVPLAGSTPVKRLSEATGVAGELDQQGGHTALLWSTDALPPEIYALEGKSLRRITTHNDSFLSTLELSPTTDLSAKTTDGNEVHGLLTLPLGYKEGTKVPLLLFIHGGPTSQDEHRFSIDRQLFSAHSYAVLNVNYRGSTGRGHDYSYAINADWGAKEVLDLLAMVDAAVATGSIDPDKLVVGGWSYGGILTDYTIASTTRFKAASSGAGTGNLFGMYGADEYILQYDNELGPPWKNPDAYTRLSYPFLHADRIKTPTLFMGGDKDFNVTLIGGEQMYQALKSVGTPAELIVYPGQFHGFTRPSFIKDRYQRWFAWYDKYLGLPTPPVTAPPAPKPM